jgi:hypothetical protein
MDQFTYNKEPSGCEECNEMSFFCPPNKISMRNCVHCNLFDVTKKCSMQLGISCIKHIPGYNIYFLVTSNKFQQVRSQSNEPQQVQSQSTSTKSDAH